MAISVAAAFNRFYENINLDGDYRAMANISKARHAWFQTYGLNNDHATAIEIWRQIFGEKFPHYA